MKPVVLFLSLLYFSFSVAEEQIVKTESLLVGESLSFQSTAFEQPITLQVHLPSSYSDTTQPYPVLYVFDGDLWFLHGVSLAKLLHHYQYAPEMIVVGISSPTGRYQRFSQAEQVSALLQNEIFERVQKRWRTSSENLLFGWQFAAGAILDLVAEPQSIASGFFAASPYPISPERLNALKNNLSTELDQKSVLLFSSSVNENQVREQSLQLESMLTAQPNEAVQWRLLTLDAENSQSAAHRTTPLETLYQGLRFYFNDYAELEFASLSDFVESGGIPYVIDYYQKRADKYAVSPEVPHEGIFNLLRMAMRGQHIDAFTDIMKHFGSSEFFAQTNLGWSMQYANFYLQNNKLGAAKKLYQRLAKRFPEHPEPLRGLGEAALGMGNPQQAIAFFRQAMSRSEQGTGANTAALEARLNQLLTTHKEIL